MFLTKLIRNVVKERQFIRRLSSVNSPLELKMDISNGFKINYVQNGNGKNNLLLLPGALGSSWTDFKPQIEQLPELLPDYTIIAWDPPGYGNSIPPKRNFNLNFFDIDAQCAHELMLKLGKPKYSILGWSDGGITGLIMAADYKDSIEKLIIWGAGAYVNGDEMKNLEDIRDVNKWSPRMREPMEKVYGAEDFAKLWSDWVDGIGEIYKNKNGDFCQEKVNKIVAPTFIVHGKKDAMVASEHIPWLKENIKNYRYFEFPDGKHNIHLRYAKEFNKLVADFLNNVMVSLFLQQKQKQK